MTSFGATTPITSRSLNTAFLQLESLIGSPNANSLSGTTLAANVVNSSLTSVGTITSGTWSGSFGAVSGANLTTLNASNLASGTVPTGRMTGFYTGITGVGILSAGSIPTTLLTGTVPSARMSGSYGGITGLGILTGLTIGGAGANRFITINAPTGYYAIQYFAINGTNKWHYELNPAGTRWSLVESGVAERIGVTNAGATFSGTVTATTFSGALSGNASTSTTSTNLSTNRTNWSTNGTISAVVGQLAWKNYGNSHTIFDASNSTTPNGGAVNNTNAQVPWTATYPTLMGWNGGNTYGVRVDSARIADIASSVGTLSALTVTAEMRVTGGAAGYRFDDRTGTGEYFVWYSSGADALLYSSRFGANVMGVARTTGITYLYRGVTGNVQYGFYGALSCYGSNNGYGGIVFPDQTSTMMVQNNLFGHYRNNSVWNFYVTGGTYVPSDARYKRDIEPLEHGMNLIREIVPVTYDPLTENTDDDPEQTVGRTHYGFTTQNILQALTNAGETRDVAIVDVGGPDETTGGDRQYLNHSALIAPMVKAIQELDARLQQLETV